MIMHVRIFLVMRESPLEGRHGQLQVARLGQHAAQVGPGFDEVFIQLDGRIVTFARGRRLKPPGI